MACELLHIWKCFRHMIGRLILVESEMDWKVNVLGNVMPHAFNALDTSIHALRYTTFRQGFGISFLFLH
jgi:hypothetical protein